MKNNSKHKQGINKRKTKGRKNTFLFGLKDEEKKVKRKGRQGGEERDKSSKISIGSFFCVPLSCKWGMRMKSRTSERASGKAKDRGKIATRIARKDIFSNVAIVIYFFVRHRLSDYLD